MRGIAPSARTRARTRAPRARGARGALAALGIAALAAGGCGDDGGTADGGARDAGADARRPDPDGGGPCVGCGPCLAGGGETTAFEQTLIELPGASWYEAPETAMRGACVDDSAGVRGVIGCRGVIDAWSSGAYDAGRRRMVVWGGGHDDYWGNELYAFDLRAGAWSRLTEPSLVTEADLNRDPLPDGRPVSRHTYDGIEHVAHLDALWAHGGSRARDGSATDQTWIFDDATGEWSTRAPGPGGLTNASAYDPGGRRVFVRSGESFFVWDADADAWTEFPGFGEPPLWPRYAVTRDKTGAFDPTRGLFWSVGSNDFFVWDAAAGGPVTDAWLSTGGGDYTNRDRIGDRPGQTIDSGGGDVYDASAPGFDYDPVTDAMVGWPNAGAPRILDLGSRTWSLGAETGAPTSETSGGTYGRFRYVAAYNVFVLVVSIDQNVFFYKHTPGCGP